MSDETDERFKKLVDDMTDALFTKYGGRVTEQQLAFEVEKLFDVIRRTAPPEIVESLLAESKAIWQDVMPDRN